MEQKRCMGCMELYDLEYGVCPHCGYLEGTPADETVHMAPGTVLEGRYVMGKVLGYGGFGATYIAWDPVLEQKVAIKEYLPSEFSTRMPGETTVTVFGGDRSEQFREGMEKFIEEAKRLSQFRNEPGIVKIFDSFQANATAYIIMEYLDGETLTFYLDREGSVSEETAMAMLTPVMKSLEIVHKEGLLHRDIAPDNIFITKDGDVKLIDFGASRYATTSHSRSLTVIIKPGYSPEEQYRSHGDQGPHTDVYALAAVMYKMLTGVTPPDALERRAMIETKRKDLLPDVHKNAKYVSPVIENAILNAMNIQIEDRTTDIPAFLAELQADKPVKRRYGKIKKIDVYAWPLWLKIVIPAVLVASLTTIGLLITGVVDFPSLFSGSIVVPEGMVAVPNVEHMKSEDAMQTLQDAGLTPVPTGNVESSYVEAGLILLQTPTGGFFAQLGAEISLTVSSGAEVAGPVNGVSTVPYVVWNTQADAEAKLQKAGLKATISTTYDNDVAAGMVISQSLDANQQIPVDSEIALVVSLGNENTHSSNQQPIYNATHAKKCPFSNGSNADVLSQEEGVRQSCYTFSHNDNGVVTNRYCHACVSGSTANDYIYTEAGDLVRKTITYRNASGTQLKSIDYYYDSPYTSRIEREYNSEGLCVQASSYNAAGELASLQTDEYDDNGQLRQTISRQYNSDGTLESSQEEHRDATGKYTDVVYCRYDSVGNIIFKSVGEYDTAGQRTRTIEYNGEGRVYCVWDYDSSGSIKDHTTYDYDSSGNIIKTTVYDASGNVIG